MNEKTTLSERLFSQMKEDETTALETQNLVGVAIVSALNQLRKSGEFNFNFDDLLPCFLLADYWQMLDEAK